MITRSHTPGLARWLALPISLTVLTVACSDAAAPLTTRVTVAVANTQPGATSWFVPVSQRAPEAQLALWASPYAARLGDTLDVYINATKGPVAVAVYRLGWYGGDGGHLMYQQSGIAATHNRRAPSHSPVRWTVRGNARPASPSLPTGSAAST